MLYLHALSVKLNSFIKNNNQRNPSQDQSWPGIAILSFDLNRNQLCPRRLVQHLQQAIP